MSDQFLEWLDSPECLNDLIPCARRVIRRAENLGIILADSYMDRDDPNSYSSAVATDLWQFLRNHAKNLTNKASTFFVLKDEAGFALFIVRQFIDFCIDQRRNDSPFHAYYRHMRTVLSEADGINYKSIPRKASYYAWLPSKDLTILPENDDFCAKNLNYEEWLASTIAFSDIHKKPFMIELSRFYWDQALRIILAEYLLPIRELVRFIATKYPLNSPREYEIEPDSEGGGHTAQLAVDDRLIAPYNFLDDDAWRRQLPELSRSIVEVDLDRIAWDCFEQLTDTERVVLCGLEAFTSLAKISKSLGMKSPSNVSYYKRSVYEKLRTSWSLWGQPDSEHYAVEEEEQAIFFRKIISFCKDADACRERYKKGPL